MAGEAPQLSFIQGEVSPEYYFRSDLTSFNSSLSKAVNVELSPLGGIRNRLGSIIVPSTMTEADSSFGRSLNLVGSDYASCVFRHYITGQAWFLEVVNNDGRIRIYLNGFGGGAYRIMPLPNGSADELVFGPVPSLTKYPQLIGPEYDFRGDIGSGMRGLNFIVHNDTLIFSKSLPVRYAKSEIANAEAGGAPGLSNYFLEDPNDSDYWYTETQVALRMMPDGYIKVEANANMRQGVALSYTYEHTTVKQATYAGAATYAIILEDDQGVDSHAAMANTIANVKVTMSDDSTLNDVIPYPVGGTITNWLKYTFNSAWTHPYGGVNLKKAKIYRSTGKNDFYSGLFKLVAQFPLQLSSDTGVPALLEVSDSGQEEAAYTAACDTSALYKQPSLIELSGIDGKYALAVGGLKSVVSTAVFQQRAFYAINKGPWWGTSVYNNTIVASKVGSIGQTILPQIINDAEVFQFNVPEEAGGHLTALASLSRLVAFTSTSTFLIQGDDAGIIRPTSINPYKILSFGCKEGVPPAVSGETCIFAASTGGLGFVTVQSNGDAIGGYASALAAHLFEDKIILSIVAMPDAKTFPRWKIKTVSGEIYTCYKVGETFSFFPELIDIPEGDTSLPLSQVLNPDFAAEGLVSISPSVLRDSSGDKIVWNISRDIPQVVSKYYDSLNHIDLGVEVGSTSRYSPTSGWTFDSIHGTSGGDATLGYLVPVSGDWDNIGPDGLTTSFGDIPVDPGISIVGSPIIFEWFAGGDYYSLTFEAIPGATPGTIRLLPPGPVTDAILRAAVPNIHFLVGARHLRSAWLSEGKVVASLLPEEAGGRLHASTTNGYLVDPTGNWEANTDIVTDKGELPIMLGHILSTVDIDYIKLRFKWVEGGKVHTAFATLEEGTVKGYVLNFEEDVPLKLRGQTPHIRFYPGAGQNVEKLLDSGIVVAEVAFNRIRTEVGPGESAIVGLPYQVALRGYELNSTNTTIPVEVPVTIESDGLVYGNFKDPQTTDLLYLRMFTDVPLPSPTATVFYELDLPDYVTHVTIGIPAVAEMETLPVASIQQDITDAKKNIDYASVILYRTKGLRIGEAGQPDVQLEVMDFTTDDSVDVPVPYTGPKGYNFASTWNLEGRIRVSGLDLQPFSISGIIPKGNVGSF